MKKNTVELQVVVFLFNEKLKFSLSFHSGLRAADFELAQLQEKLRETELVMENIVSSAHHSPDRWVTRQP